MAPNTDGFISLPNPIGCENSFVLCAYVCAVPGSTPITSQLSEGPEGSRMITCDVPTVSEWGLVVLTLLGMTAGTIMLARRRRGPAAAAAD